MIASTKIVKAKRNATVENCEGCGRFVAWKDYTEEHAGGQVVIGKRRAFVDRWFRGHRAGTGCRKDEVES